MRKEMTKSILLLMLFLTQAAASSAEVKITMEDFDIASSEYKQVALLLTNDQEATALQATLELPAGLVYGGSVYKTDRIKGRGAEVQASTSTGKLVIVETGGTIAPGEGAIITFYLRRNSDMTDGDHEIKITEIVVSDANGDQLNSEEEYTVNVHALGIADCAFAATQESVEMNVGDEFLVNITLTNQGVTNLSALQGRLTLPEGLEIVPGEYGKFIYNDSRTPSPLEFTFQGYEGYTAFVLSSTSNKTISGTSGTIFSFKVKANEALEGEITLSDLRVAATTGQSAQCDDVVINVKVNKLYTLGDVNNDGVIDTRDAICVLKHVVGSTPEGFVVEAADFNEDGEIDTRDAIAILKKVVE